MWVIALKDTLLELNPKNKESGGYFQSQSNIEQGAV